jgi:hypothetical protein
MATTKREKKKEPEIVEPSDKFLSPDDHRQVLVLPKIIENAQLLSAVEEQNLRNYLLELELLKIKIEKQKEVVAQKHHIYESEKKKYNHIMNDITTKYELKGKGFSYDNESGKIIEEL